MSLAKKPQETGAEPGEVRVQWDCGNGHLLAERLLRIIEHAWRMDLTEDLLSDLRGLVTEAGPEYCHHSLTEPELPF